MKQVSFDKNGGIVANTIGDSCKLAHVYDRPLILRNTSLVPSIHTLSQRH